MKNNLNKKILLIDDDVEILNLLSRYLAPESYTIFTASSGRAGLQTAQQNFPDLIILDIVMPKVDGFEVCKKLQENQNLSYCPVIFLSAFDDQKNRMKAFSLGAVDFLPKPILKEELLKKVRQHLSLSKKWQGLKKEGKSKEKLPLEESKKKRPVEEQSYKEKINSFHRFLSKELILKDKTEEKLHGVSFLNIYQEMEKLGIDSARIAQILAKFCRLKYVSSIEPNSVVLGLLPYSFCQRNLVIPISENDTSYFIISNPLDLSLLDSLEKVIGRGQNLNCKLSNPDTIKHFFEDVQTLDISYLSKKEEIGLDKDKISEDDEDTTPSKREIKLVTGQDSSFLHDEKLSAFVSMTNQILTSAINQRSSDIHIEPKENKAYVRFRVDGILRDAYFIQPETCKGLISRLKVLAHMNITETRRPQDGAIEAMLDKKKVKMRLATAGTPYGESMIIRIFNPNVSVISFSELGMNDWQTELMEKMIASTQGLILVVGPTGSGKTTTIYSLLNSIDTKTRSLVSIEDPVEYSIPYANQQEVNEKIGVTFENLLKSAVRQDPDMLFIGEIRDKYSARFAIEAASTGHLTFSTLHTVNATTAIFRLERFEISRSALAEAILVIIAQRLVRNLCPHCKEIREITKEDKNFLANFTQDISHNVGYPTGCSKCNLTGYLGRTGVYEILSFDSSLTDLVRKGVSLNEIRSLLAEQGAKFLYHHALEKIRQKTLSVKEAKLKVLSEVEADHIYIKNESSSSYEEEKLLTPLAGLDAERKKILVVEDDEDMINLISRFLTDKNYELSSAQDGIEALMKIGKINFDLILSDINMPNLNGIKLLEILKQKGINIPVIFITSRTSQADEIKGLSLGVADYIKKPISKEILIFRIERILKGSAP